MVPQRCDNVTTHGGIHQVDKGMQGPVGVPEGENREVYVAFLILYYSLIDSPVLSIPVLIDRGIYHCVVQRGIEHGDCLSA